MDDSSSSSSSSSSDVEGHWVYFRLSFTCSSNRNQGLGYGYAMSHLVIGNGSTRHDHKPDNGWRELYNDPRNSIGWGNLSFFPDPSLKYRGEDYFDDYPKPLPKAIDGFCPKPEIDKISPHLPSSGDSKFDFDRDRFSGYNLNTVKFPDGFDYYVVGVHPYFFNQPIQWQTPAYQIGFHTAGGHNHPIYTLPRDTVQPDNGFSPYEETHHRSPNIPI